MGRMKLRLSRRHPGPLWPAASWIALYATPICISIKELIQ